MHLSETTNGRLAEVIVMVTDLIDWAEGDAEHAAEAGASGIASDDRRRVKTLRRARELLQQCVR